MSHFRQYPPNTQYVYSYFESRGGKFNDICFFGLQYFIKRYLTGVVVTQEKIEEAALVINAHMGPDHFNRKGWEHILHKCGGKLPVAIKAVPEGTIVPVKNVLFTMVNTDPECYWLTNYLETLLVQVCARTGPGAGSRPADATRCTGGPGAGLRPRRSPALAGLVPDDRRHVVARAEEDHRAVL